MTWIHGAPGLIRFILKRGGGGDFPSPKNLIKSKSENLDKIQLLRKMYLFKPSGCQSFPALLGFKMIS